MMHNPKPNPNPNIIPASNATQWYIKNSFNTNKEIEVLIKNIEKTSSYIIQVENYYNIKDIIYDNGYIYVILSDKESEFDNHEFCRKYKVNKYYLSYPEIFRL